jgi:hypothetical protein
MYEPAPDHPVCPSTSSASTSREFRIDTGPAAAVISRRLHSSRRRRSSWLQWGVLSLGVMMFTCGAVLIAWSFNQDQQELWNLGAPLALAGQVAFLVGLVLQLDVLWQQSKWTTHTIEELDRRAAAAAGASAAAPASVGSASTAERAAISDPQTLLSDLKGQLDRMATRLSRP